MTKKRQDARQGFTLLELMIVVAIVGVMASLAVASIQRMLDAGRVNGAANVMARLLADGYTRAVAQTCRTSVQINGPSYTLAAPPDPKFPNRPNAITTFMKGDCTSVNPWFEGPIGATPGDRVISVSYFEQGVLEVGFQPPGAVTTAPYLGADAVVFSWDRAGRMMAASDLGNSGTFNLAAQQMIRARFTRPGNSQSAAETVVPIAGMPHLP